MPASFAAIPCAPAVATSPATSTRGSSGKPTSARVLTTPAKVSQSLLQPKFAGVILLIPPISPRVPASVAFATPLEIPSPCCPHATFDCRLRWAAGSKVRLRDPRVAWSRETRASPSGSASRATAFKGSREATPFLSSRPGLLLGLRPLAGWPRRGTSARDGGRARATRGRCPPSAVLRIAPVGGSAVSPPARKVPLLDGRPSGCPLHLRRLVGSRLLSPRNGLTWPLLARSANVVQPPSLCSAPLAAP